MSISGWIFMILSWSVILGMFTYCMYRTLKKDTQQNPEQTPENENTV